MIISVAALVAAFLPLLFGGKLSRLSAVTFRHVPWIVAALLVQIVIIEILPGPRVVLELAHVATYVIAGWFVLANRRIPGLWLIGTGAGLNGLAITLNGGTLPARPEALRTAGIRFAEDQFVNSGVLAHPRLPFLGDVFAIPAGLPLANVFSIGDVLIVLGAGWTAWALLGTRWTEPWRPDQRQESSSAADDAARPFTRELLGYRKLEVNDLVKEQHEQLAALGARLADTERELVLAREELDRALNELGSRGRPEYLGERLSEILRLATEEGEQELGAARNAAAGILEDARSEADRVAREAEARADDMLHAARQDCTDRLADARAEANHLVGTAQTEAQATLESANEHAGRARAQADQRSEQIMALQQHRLNAVLGAYQETVRRMDAAKELLTRFLADEFSKGDPAQGVEPEALPAMPPALGAPPLTVSSPT
jgi:cell division septum initiation protein DivIVA